MKKGFLFMAIAGIALLFTACEDDMDKGITGGGGMQDANNIYRSVTNTNENDTTTIVRDVSLKNDE